MNRGLIQLSRRRFRVLAVFASTLLVFGSVAVVTTDAASFKPFEVDGLPGPTNAQPGQYTLTIRNLNTTQQLGSLQITLGGGVTFTAVGQNGTLTSSTQVTFQNLNIPAQQTGQVSFTVAAPCGASTAQWTFAAQQANQWQSGNSANYLTLAEINYAGGGVVGSPTTRLAQPNPSGYSNTTCTYSMTSTLFGGSVVGGANAGSITITDGSGGTLTSVTATVPSPYSITYGGGNPGTSATFNVNLAPNASTTVNFTLNAPCTSPGFDWTFSTTPAAFSLSSPTAPIHTTLATPACSIKFIPANNGVEVANAEWSGGTVFAPDTRTLTAGIPGAGLGVQVALFDLSGGTALSIPGQAVEVDLTGGTGPLLGTSSGTTAADGTFTFNGLQVGSVGFYRLIASGGAQVTTDTSNQFSVLPTIYPCNPNQTSCTAKFNPVDGNSQSSITAYCPNKDCGFFSGGPNFPNLVVSCSFSPFNYSDQYDTNTTWVVYQGNASTKSATLIINKSWVQNTANNGLSFYRVCFAAPYQFNTGVVTNSGAGGTSAVPILSSSAAGWPNAANLAGNNATDILGGGTQTWYVGTLPSCSTVGNVAPCVTSTSGAGGNRILNFSIPAGDPVWR